MEEAQKLLERYESEQQRIVDKKKYSGKTADLRYVLGLIHGVKNTMKIFNCL